MVIFGILFLKKNIDLLINNKRIFVYITMSFADTTMTDYFATSAFATNTSNDLTTSSAFITATDELTAFATPDFATTINNLLLSS